MNEQIIVEKSYLIENMEKKDNKLNDVLDVLVKHENSLKFCI